MKQKSVFAKKNRPEKAQFERVWASKPGDPFVCQNVYVVLHDVLWFADGLGVLLDGQLLGGALETEKVLDVEVGFLLEAGPLGVLGVDPVEAELTDADSEQ